MQNQNESQESPTHLDDVKSSLQSCTCRNGSKWAYVAAQLLFPKGVMFESSLLCQALSKFSSRRKVLSEIGWLIKRSK